MATRDPLAASVRPEDLVRAMQPPPAPRPRPVLDLPAAPAPAPTAPVAPPPDDLLAQVDVTFAEPAAADDLLGLVDQTYQPDATVGDAIRYAPESFASGVAQTPATSLRAAEHLESKAIRKARNTLGRLTDAPAMADDAYTKLEFELANPRKTPFITPAERPWLLDVLRRGRAGEDVSEDLAAAARRIGRNRPGEWRRWLENYTKENFEVPEHVREHFVSQVAQGGGSTVGFLLSRVVGGLPGAMVFSAGTGAGEALQRADRAGITDEATLDKVARMGVLPGLTEVVPIENLFRLGKMASKMAPAAFKERVIAVLREALQQGVVEGAQESAQGTMQNAIERLTHTPDRELFEHVAREGLVGFTVGMLFGGGASAIGQAAAPDPTASPPITPLEQAAARETAIDSLQPRQPGPAAAAPEEPIVGTPTTVPADFGTTLAPSQPASGEVAAEPVPTPGPAPVAPGADMGPETAPAVPHEPVLSIGPGPSVAPVSAEIDDQTLAVTITEGDRAMTYRGVNGRPFRDRADAEAFVREKTGIEPAGVIPTPAPEATSYFEEVDRLEPSAAIQELESAAVGSVANFGQVEEAANMVRLLPEYPAYRAALQEAARQRLGPTFTVYRSLSPAEMDGWRAQDPAGPISTTLNPPLAERWRHLAQSDGRPQQVVAITATPDAIVMRGNSAEAEIILDSNEVSFDQVRPHAPELPHEPDRYFERTAEAVDIPIERLSPTKIEQGSISNAAALMQGAYEGRNTRRKPISVRAEADGSFTVLDGNATFGVAREAGWPTLVAEVVETADAAREQPGQRIDQPVTPSRSSVSEVAEGAPTTSSAPTPPGIQPEPGTQVSTLPEPSDSSTTLATSPDTETGGITTRFTDLRLGDIESPSNKIIIQGTTDFNALLEYAPTVQPVFNAGLEAVAGPVEGARAYGSRVKDRDGMAEKVRLSRETERSPATFSDYLGGRLILDTPAAIEPLLASMEQQFGAPIEIENFLEGVGKIGYRAIHAQVEVTPGFSAEVQIVPAPIEAVMHEAHEIRQPFKRLDPRVLHGDDLQAMHDAHARIQTMYDEALQGTEWESLLPVERKPRKIPKKAAANTGTATTANKRVAERLRKGADALDKQIEAKRTPAIANQRLTPRRERIARGMREEADKLADTQAKMRQLAELHEAGAVPDVLAKVTSKGAIERLRATREWPRQPKRDDHEHTRESLRERRAELKKIGITTKQQFTAAKKALDNLGSFELTEEQLNEREIARIRGELVGVKIPGFFETPTEVALRMVEMADIQPGEAVLEPSAGAGSIARQIRANAPEAKLTAIEINMKLAEILNRQGIETENGDFLQHAGGPYDKVVMNPPFERMQDAEHVQLAYDLLKPGGRLVSIMSPHGFNASDSKSVAWREWLDERERLGDVVEVEDLPSGTFEQTQVASKLISIEKADDTDVSEGTIAADGDSVFTPAGREIRVTYELAELESLVPSHLDDMTANPDFPSRFQPRQRERAASQKQIADIASNLRPPLLGRSATTAEGAPMVDEAGIVESGNARVLALRKAKGSKMWQRYRDWLRGEGYNLDGWDAPVLVRRRLTKLSDEDRAGYVRESNERTTASMGEAEQAAIDAGSITPAVLNAYKGGDIENAANRDFVRSFIATVLPATEAAQAQTGQGALSQAGIRRIENALFAAAYQDADLLAALREETDANWLAIGKAMVQAAPAWARMRADVSDGAVRPEFDITPNLLEALRLVRRQRTERIKLAELVAQDDMISGQTDPLTIGFLRMFFRNDEFTRPRAGPAVGDMLTRYTSEADKQSGDQLFGDEVGPGQALDAVLGKDGDLFGESVAAMVRTYHGTGADFERYSVDYIGTGEGAIAEGWGLYFGEAEGTGKSYHAQIGRPPHVAWGDASGRRVYAEVVGAAKERAARAQPRRWADGRELSEEIGRQAQNAIRVYEARITPTDEGGWREADRELAESVIQADIDQKVDFYRRNFEKTDDIGDWAGLAVYEAIRDDMPRPRWVERAGAVRAQYLTPDADEWLDLDKRLHEQSPRVQAALRQIPQDAWDWIDGQLDDRGMNFMSPDEAGLSDIYTGRELYQALVRYVGEGELIPGFVPSKTEEGSSWARKEEVSRYLLSLGIPGNRYLDQLSRNTSQLWQVIGSDGEVVPGGRHLSERQGEIALTNTRLSDPGARLEMVPKTSNYVLFDDSLIHYGEPDEADELPAVAAMSQPGAGRRRPAGQRPQGVAVVPMGPQQPRTSGHGPGARWVGRRQESIEGEPSSPALRREEIIGELTKFFGVPVYRGRIRNPRVEGFYRRRLGEVRARNNSDLEVVAHEFAHLLDDRIPDIRQQWQRGPNWRVVSAELKSVSYDVESVTEGWAEFIRLWMTQRHEAANRAPTVHEWWTKFLARPDNKALSDVLNRARDRMDAWYEQDPLTRAKSKIGAPPAMNELTEGMRGGRFQQAGLDDLHGFARAETQLYGEIRDGGFYQVARNTRGALSVVLGSIQYGAPRWTANRIYFQDLNGNTDRMIKRNDRGGYDVLDNPNYEQAGLAWIFDRVPRDQLSDFAVYMVGKSAAELKEQGRENLFTRAEIAAMLALENDTFRQMGEDYQRYNQQLLDFAEQGGVLNPETRAKFKRDFYMPFYRIASGDEKVKASTRGGRHQGHMVIARQLRGGTQNIGDPIENMIHNTRIIIESAIYNRARLQAVDEIMAAEGGARFLVKIPSTSEKVAVLTESAKQGWVAAMRQAARQGKGAALTAEEQAEIEEMAHEAFQDLPQMMHMWLHGKAPAGTNVITVMRNGKPEYYEMVGDEGALMFRAFEALPRHGATPNRFVDFLNDFRRVKQWTVTHTLTFMLRNLSRDPMHAWAFSKYGHKPFIDAARGLYSRIQRDPYYRDYLASQAGFSTHYEQEASLTNRRRLYRNVSVPKGGIIDHTMTGLEFVDRLSTAAEEATRIGEYKRAVRFHGASQPAAGYAGAEITTDFRMNGDHEAFKFLYKSFEFLKAGSEGLYRGYRGLLTNQAGNQSGVAIRMMLLGMGSAMLWALNHDNPLYDERPEWEKDTHWHFWIPNAKWFEWVAEKGDWATGDIWPETAEETHELVDGPFLLPKPWEVGLFAGTIVEKALDGSVAAIEGDFAQVKRASRGIKRAVLDMFRMPTAPTIIGPIFETAWNYDPFRERAVVPPSLKGDAPGMQYNAYTSRFLAMVGRKSFETFPESEWLQLSPIITEHLIYGYLSSMGMSALMAADRAFFDDIPALRWEQVPGARAFYKPSAPSSSYVQQFYERARQVEQLHEGWVRLSREDRANYGDRIRESERFIANAHLMPTRAALSRMTRLASDVSFAKTIDTTHKLADAVARLPHWSAKDRVAKLRGGKYWDDMPNLKFQLIEIVVRNKNEIARRAVESGDLRARELKAGLDRLTAPNLTGDR